MCTSWYTVCPRSSDPFYIVTYYNKMGHYFLGHILYKCGKTFWIDSWRILCGQQFITHCIQKVTISIGSRLLGHAVCPGSSDPFHIVIYYIKWVKSSSYMLLFICLSYTRMWIGHISITPLNSSPVQKQ